MPTHTLTSGFMVKYRRCEHYANLTILSYTSVTLIDDGDGSFRFDCVDPDELFGASGPVGSLSRLEDFLTGAIHDSKDKSDPVTASTLILADEIALEHWLNSEFLEKLWPNPDNEDTEPRRRAIATTAHRIVLEVRGEMAKNAVLSQG